MKNQLQLVSKTIICGLVLSIAWGSSASLSAQAPRTFPYQGYLEIDGVPLNGIIAMFFYIVDDIDQPVSTGRNTADETLWYERHEFANKISVSEGKFNIELGTRTAFGADVFSSHPVLYLGIKVFHNGGWRDLGTRQRILPVPYAIHAKEAEQAEDFSVSGTLTAPNVQGQMVVSSGDARGADSNGSGLKVVGGGGTLVIDGNEVESSTELTFQWTGKGSTRTGGDLSVDKNLTVGTARDGESGNVNVQRSLTVGTNTTLQGDLSVGGTLSLPANAFTVTRHHVDAHNGDGRVVMTQKDRSFCSLTQVSVNDVHANQDGECDINEGDENWVMVVNAEGSDTDVDCEARCLSWNIAGE